MLKLYTLAGELLTLISEAKLAELTSLHSNLPNGVYLVLRVRADGRRELEKLVLKR